MNRIAILLLRKNLCEFGVYQPIETVEAIFVETSLGECLETVEKKEYRLVVRTTFW